MAAAKRFILRTMVLLFAARFCLLTLRKVIENLRCVVRKNRGRGAARDGDRPFLISPAVYLPVLTFRRVGWRDRGYPSGFDTRIQNGDAVSSDEAPVRQSVQTENV